MDLARSSMKVVVIAAIVTTLVVGCSDTFGPPVGLTYAAATSTCGPTDGPAIAIYLAPEPIESINPALPYVRLHVNRSLDEAAQESWARVGTDEAGAWRHTPIPEVEFATVGGIRIDEVESGNTIRGRVNVVFPSGQVVGEFRAEWFDRTVVCG